MPADETGSRWASPRPTTIDDLMRASGGRRDLRRLHTLVARAFALVWRSAPRELLLAGALQLLAGLSLAGQLLVVRRLLSRAAGTDGIPELGSLAPELAAFGVLFVIVAVAVIAQREQQRTLGERVEKYTTGRVLDISTTVDLIDYDRPQFYDRLQRARVNASVRPLQIANGILGLIGSGVAVAAVGITLLFIEPLVVALIVVGSIPALVLNRLSSRVLHGFAVRQTPGDRRRAYLYQALSRKEEAQEVRAFDASAHLRGEHDRSFDERIADLRDAVRRRLVYGTLTALVAAAVTVGSVALLLGFVRIGRISASDAAVAAGAVVLVATRIRGLIGSTGSLYEGALFLQDFTDFVEEGEAEIARRRILTRDPPTLAPTFRRIDFEGVGFTYPSRDQPSLVDITLSIEHGEVVALVGENGSGKTTLTKLLSGLYEPSEGRILWDGCDVAMVDPAALRAQVTVIFQDFARYFLSAHENIAISRIAHMGETELARYAAQRAGADEFLAALPHGYRSLLGPSFMGGSDLSTGQWQRVALARAYFRNAPMLILDEPTAALDPRGEYEIFQHVRRLAAGHTVVLISHRFSSVRAADRIVVLDSGRIVEEGDHETLLARNGLYAELFRLQAEGYRGATR